MKIPSISNLYNASKETFLRFPLVCLASILGTAVALYLIEYEREFSRLDELFKTLLILITSVPLLFGTAMLLERKKLNKTKKWGLQAIVILIVIAHYFLLPSDIDNQFAAFYQIFVFGIIYSLFASISPFLVKNEITGFWNYNKQLFIRLATTALYAGVLFIGIVVALLTIDFLLDVNVPDRLYPQIWIIAAGLIAPWFFLHGVPSDLSQLNKVKNYHKGIRIFSQYILTPLVVTYFVILYLYSGKIILNNEWTEGLVSWLIIFFSITGVLTNLILYPIRQEKEHQWARWFLKGFYLSIVPLLAILFYSVWLRVEPYGITENRYWVVLLGVWLLGTAIYTLITHQRNIKIIIISLALIGLFGNIGPWGAYSVSERSQVNQLTNLLNQANLLENGKAKKSTNEVDDDTAYEIENKLQYLVDNHGMQSIQHLFTEDLSQLNTVTNSENHYDILDLLGIESKISFFRDQRHTHYLYLHQDPSISPFNSRKIHGYDYLIDFNLRSDRDNTNFSTFEIDGSLYKFEFLLKENSIQITENDQPIISANLSDFTEEVIKKYSENYSGLYQSEFTFTTKNDQAEISILFQNLEATSATGKNPKTQIQFANGTALINIKKNDINLKTNTTTETIL